MDSLLLYRLVVIMHDPCSFHIVPWSFGFPIHPGCFRSIDRADHDDHCIGMVDQARTTAPKQLVVLCQCEANKG